MKLKKEECFNKEDSECAPSSNHTLEREAKEKDNN